MPKECKNGSFVSSHITFVHVFHTSWMQNNELQCKNHNSKNWPKSPQMQRDSLVDVLESDAQGTMQNSEEVVGVTRAKGVATDHWGA